MTFAKTVPLILALSAALWPAAARAERPTRHPCVTATRAAADGPLRRTVCGTGAAAVWLFDGGREASQDPRFAFGWRDAEGLPAFDDDEAIPEAPETVLVRRADGATVAVFGAHAWRTATMHANHAFFEPVWSKHRRWLWVGGSERYFADSIDVVHFSPDGDRVAVGRLRDAVIGPIERDFATRGIVGDFGPTLPESLRIDDDGRVTAEVHFWARVTGGPDRIYDVAFRLAETRGAVVVTGLTFRWRGAAPE
ncbi:hypothetical protein EYW49_14205 [Siculibacillus lacustris]|uniref:Uncharacterized protein n=1 Tax=Siculibacillus lacustris TaxID=1549641 RepID=A0A4V2KT93_9HYPH|nr:hypothetical protein [Siculibacillus lacustris]TBW36256.1 hypothetical protein EYW49_14205 [Siculibacillus lacustris]